MYGDCACWYGDCACLFPKTELFAGMLREVAVISDVAPAGENISLAMWGNTKVAPLISVLKSKDTGWRYGDSGGGAYGDGGA